MKIKVFGGFVWGQPVLVRQSGRGALAAINAAAEAGFALSLAGWFLVCVLCAWCAYVCACVRLALGFRV